MRIMSAKFRMTLEQHLPMRAGDAWRVLCDWEDHGRWVPFTKVETNADGSFVAYTGVWPMRLTDRMQVSSIDEAGMSAVIEKLGPYVKGEAAFSVRAFDEDSCVVVWRENISIPLVPSFLSPLLKYATKAAFKLALKRMPPA